MGDFLVGKETKVADAAKNPQLANSANIDFNSINYGAKNEFRGGQVDLMHDLQDQAAGQGPSLAQAQLKAGTDQNIAAQMAMAASQRGGGGFGARLAAQNMASSQQQAAQQAAQLRMQEQLTARQGLGQLLASGRGADLGMAEMASNRDVAKMNGQIQGGLGAAQIDEANNKRRSFGGFVGSIAQGVQGMGSLFGGGAK
jgi:hypothetical protein